jgi:cobalt-zinc-cadmium efflux system protein
MQANHAPNHDQNHDHHDDDGHSHDFSGQSETRLCWVLLLTTGFLIAEAVGGLVFNSLALLSDAAHVFTDAAAIAIAIVAIRIGRRPADDQRTYGYYRFEILAVIFNASLLFAVAGYILYEAYQRLSSPPELHSSGMMLVAGVGLVVNLICMKIITGGQDGSLNMRAAYLEVMADMVGSGAVIIGGAIIYFTQWWWVDSLTAILIGLWVLPRTWSLFSQSVHILLEGVPSGINVAEVREALQGVEGVESLHDLHVWSLTVSKVSLTVHLVCPERDPQEVLEDAMDMLGKRFAIHHVAIQCEEHACAMSRPEVEHYQEADVPVHDYSHSDRRIDPPRAVLPPVE